MSALCVLVIVRVLNAVQGGRRTSGALAKLVALHKLPAFLSAVPPGGAFLEVVLAHLGTAQPRGGATLGIVYEMIAG